MLVKRSELGRLLEPDHFFYATGIEDTFITHPWSKTGRSLDEYELTKHYDYWETDLHLVRELGVSAVRYGIPWYKANPAPGQWDWSWADKTLNRLLENGIDPIVDLVHYGTPSWLENSFLNPDYSARIAEYAHELASRFKGRVHWYTPLNEPRITAWYCGRIGWWPPYRREWRGFCEVMIAICKGIVQTCKALLAVDAEIVLNHVDPTDIYRTLEPALELDTQLRRDIAFLALDLVTGRVNEQHTLWNWLLKHKTNPQDLAWFLNNSIQLDVIGLNMYPMFSNKRVIATTRGVRNRMEYAHGDIVQTIARMYYERYKAPMYISETASLGSIARRRKWLADSLDSVKAARKDGIPIIGYTWWPMFSLVAWGYRQQQMDFSRYLLRMGLWDLDPNQGLARVKTPLVDLYQTSIGLGVERVGCLHDEVN